MSCRPTPPPRPSLCPSSFGLASAPGGLSASARASVETARNDGLKALYEALDVETESQKASLDYLLMLTDKSTDGLSHIMAYVDFDAANAFR